MNEQLDGWMKDLIADAGRAKPTLRARLIARWRSMWLNWMFFKAWVRSWGTQPVKRSRYVHTVESSGGNWVPVSLGWGRDPGQPLHYELASIQVARGSRDAMVAVTIDGKLCCEAWAHMPGPIKLWCPIVLTRSAEVMVRVTGDEKGSVYLWSTAVFIGPVERPWSPLVRALQRLRLRIERIRYYGRGW
jgi:hypothetical protein